MFWLQNGVIQARFSNFACSRPVPVVTRPEKVIKIRPQHSSDVLTGNNKNCTPNIRGMFRVQNGVIRARFSTSPAPCLFLWCLDPEKSSKFDWNIFQLYWRETIRTAPQTLWVCFGCKMESSEPGERVNNLALEDQSSDTKWWSSF